MEEVKWGQLPKEIQERMLYEQERQGNERNPDVFMSLLVAEEGLGGFDWISSEEGHLFWSEILEDGDFDVFYEKYPPMEDFEVEFEGTTYRVNFHVDKPDTVCAIIRKDVHLPHGFIVECGGRATCSDNDVFCYKVGRKIAFDRARLHLDKDLRAALTKEFNRLEGYPYQVTPSELSEIVDEFFEYLDSILESKNKKRENYADFFSEIRDVCKKHNIDVTDFTFRGEQIIEKDGKYFVDITI